MLTPAEVDFLLVRYDQTEPALQRNIVAHIIVKCNELQARLKRIEDAANADAADLEEPRDGTKLTRHGLVQLIAHLQEELAAARALLKELNTDSQFQIYVCRLYKERLAKLIGE